ncbi:intraflagellar transport protein 56 isoform X3 [Bacillus rossius redtenbacheri]|uniref:intraflagellar transport protein 56 isoform X3 n=1 Tax=Bacillus rossius redtenbacheri TaxID=93214 RepID=UPI002FDE888F
MILSRAKPATHAGTAGHGKPQHGAKQAPRLEEFLAARDYTGALTVLEFGGGKGDPETELWVGYCAFHLGDYRRAASVYEALGHSKSPAPQVALNLACCYFFLGMYPEAYRAAEQAEECGLRTRLMFHLAHKLGDEARLMQFHQLLEDVTEDQLCLAAIHYLRSHYQEAIDIYKKLLLDHRDYLALNVYVALCYYKLDYYDVSQEVLQVYLQAHPDSAVAINLKACNHFRLYNGKAAENELRTLLDQSSSSFSFGRDLVRHNQVVFRGGEAALQVLPALVDVVPEARLNLVIYYLRQDDIHEAYALIKDLEPVVPQEYILKAVVNAALGQEIGSREHLKAAQQLFQVVGSSSSECDTIPGRQCMASCLFLQRQFEDVLVYLGSIRSFFSGDDAFNFNYAQAQAAKGNFREAEEAFLLVQSDKLRADYTYISHLARCYVMNKKPQAAWELYRAMETSSESFGLLQLLANDCYRMGHFWLAAKAFDVLERLDPGPEHWEGKRGACVGVFQRVVAGRTPRETLAEVIQLLRGTANSQVEHIIRVMKRWAKDNRVNV